MTNIRKSLFSRMAFTVSSIVLSMAVVIVLASFFIQQEMKGIATDIDKELHQLGELQEASASFKQVVADSRGYIAYGRENFLVDLNESKEAFSNSLEHLTEKLQADQDKSEGQALSAIHKNYEEYQKLIEIAKELKSSNDTEGLQQLSLLRTTPLVADTTQLFDKQITQQENLVNGLVQDNNQYTNYSMLFPLLVLIAFIVTGYYVLRSLRKNVIAPIEVMEQAVKQIAAGRYIHEEHDEIGTRPDELGLLSRGMRLMSQELESRQQELEMNNFKLLEQRDELEAQNEEILAQQDEQTELLMKLTEREQQLEIINSYQEKLTGINEMEEFIHQSVPALLKATGKDAAILYLRMKEPVIKDQTYAFGYPAAAAQPQASELFGPAARIFLEAKPYQLVRPLSGYERGIHNAYESALDQYYPLFNDQQEVLGFLLLTKYGFMEMQDQQNRIVQGLVTQFSMALLSQLVNEDRRHQALALESLNHALSLEKVELKTQRDLIHAIFESIHEGMLLSNHEGEIIFRNERMNTWFCRDEQNRCKTVQELFELWIAENSKEAREVFERMTNVFNGSYGQIVERLSIYDAQQEVRYYEMTLSVVKSRDDKDGSYLFVFRDRTEEEKIDEMKNEFVSIVSHELRTPLASVLGFVEIMLHREVTKEKQKKYLDTIYKEANRLSNLINDFLDLQRMESGKQQYMMLPLNITELIRECTERWISKQTKEIHFTVETPNLWVQGDRDRLVQVLDNLISNAIKYSPDAASIDIRLGIDGDGQRVKIEVQDYGLGIPDSARDKLFSKFYRVDNSDRRQIGGTGLGLAITKELIDSHGGEITYTSVVKQGTSFYVYLPRYMNQELGGHILVLEDDEHLSAMIVAAFESLELPTMQLSSAESAIAALRNTNQPPLLCIVDIQLKGLLDGWSVVKELMGSSEFNSTPLIVSTVLDPPEHYRERSTEKYLQKPFTVERLIEISKQLMADREPSLVFPYQDKESIKQRLQEQGLNVVELKETEDTIEVDVKQHGGSVG